MLSLRVFLLLASVLLTAGVGGCEFLKSDPKNPKETFVGLLEKKVTLLMKTGRMLNHGVQTVRDHLRGVASLIPVLNIPTDKGTSVGDALNPYRMQIKAIFPGTYWCGDGDISPNQKDLGLFERTDACCRAHDSCPEGIPAQEERYGLMNNGIFTRSSCQCDKSFYHCLKQADSLIATKIGTTYFNVLRPQCFRKYYPIVGCAEYAGHRLLYDKCEKYRFNRTEPKTMQWFDNPDFIVL